MAIDPALAKHLPKQYADVFFSAAEDRATERGAPKVIFSVDNLITHFFVTCPQLIPESAPKPITIPSTPTATPTKSGSFPYAIILKTIIRLAALYLLYKVVSYASNFWQESKSLG